MHTTCHSVLVRDPSRERMRRAAMPVLLVAVVAASLVFAYVLLFVTFRFPDDEGYFLLAFRAHRDGASLYGDIDTVYGPFYFQVVGALFRLAHLPLDHVTSRWFALAVMVLAGLGIHRYVQRVTGSRIAALAAYFLAFANLSALASTPLHPTGLIALLVSALVLASLGFDSSSKRSLALAISGALTAAIALSKLNAGFFVLMAFAALFSRFAPRTRWSHVARLAVHGVLILLPFVMMGPELGEHGMLPLACVTSLSIVPFALLAAAETRDRSRLPVVPYLAGAFALSVVVLAPCVFGESGFRGMWSALVVGTLRFPGAFLAAPTFHPGAEVAIALVAAPILIAGRMRVFERISPHVATLLKLAGGVAMIALCFARLADCIRALPLAWLVALPRRNPQPHVESRTLLGLLVVLLALHAYPIGGNQAVLFAALLPAAGVVTVCDALADAPETWRVASQRTAWKLVGAIALIAMFALHPAVRLTAPILARQYRKCVELELPGAETLRLSERRVAELQWTAANLARHGATFVGVPGVHSFYFWSGLAPPLRFYPNTWVLFYDGAAEQKLADALLSSERPCIVRNRQLIEFYTGTRDCRDGPLARAAACEFESAGKAGEYELLIPRGVHADLVLSVLPEEAPRALREKFGIDRALRLSFPELAGVQLARVVLRDWRFNVDVLDSASESDERRARIVDGEGKELLGVRGATGVSLDRRSALYLIGPTPDFTVDPESVLVRALDTNGRVAARLVEPTGVR